MHFRFNSSSINSVIFNLKQPSPLVLYFNRPFHTTISILSKNCPYVALNLKPGASFQEIKDSYRKLCFELHPDRSNSVAVSETGRAKNEDIKLIEVIKAYQLLRGYASRGSLETFAQSLQQNRKNPYGNNSENFSKNNTYSGPTHDQFYYRSMYGNTKPVYGRNSHVTLAILGLVFVGLSIQYVRFRYHHGTIFEIREKHFRLSAEAYTRVVELAHYLGAEDRLELFLKEYENRRK